MRISLVISLVFLTLNILSCVMPQVKESKSREIPTRDESLPKIRVVVLPLIDGLGEKSDSFKEELRNQFIKALNKTKAFILIDAKEIKMNYTLIQGEYNLKDLGKENGNLGISAVIEPKLVDIKLKRKADEVGIFREIKTDLEAIVKVRVVAVRNSRELLNQSKSRKIERSDTQMGDKKSSLNQDVMIHVASQAFEDTIPEIILSLDQIHWEGRIALVNGDRVFLNVGKISGLQIGDILKVLEDGEEVFDPETGGLIGKVPGRLKGTLEVVSFFGQDGAISVIHSGSGFKENDRVELY